MDPSVWGPSGWTMLHSTALYTELHPKEGSIDFFAEYVQTFVSMLPCETCQEHAKEYLQKHPIEGHLFDWTVHFHNAVNSRLGKPTMDPRDARAQWSNVQCKTQCNVKHSNEDKPVDKRSSLLTFLVVVFLLGLLWILLGW